MSAAKEFYTRLGWRLDADYDNGDFRVVQFAWFRVLGLRQKRYCGGARLRQGLYLIVSDIGAARDE